MGLIVFLAMLAAQKAPDAGFKQAGACARCHVAATLEWSVSKHVKAGTGCVECHGASAGHVADERNGIKPERVPHGAAITALCRTCHANQKHDGCEGCHHVHALLNPKAQKPAAVAAPAAQPAVVKRRPNSAIPGFELVDKAFDRESGLPLHVRVSGFPVEMTLIPAGDADLGEGDSLHTVRVAAFYLARTEVTQEVWLSLEKENPSTAAGAQLPVHNVSWNDARRWIALLNARVPGGGFRLPSEAEWEFAASAGDPVARAWYRTGVEPSGPHVVATRGADMRGLYDMAGNVWEWCSSLLRPYPYDAGDGREAAEAPGLRVLRGGGFADSADYLRRSFRHGERPDRRLPCNGFRLARSAPR